MCEVWKVPMENIIEQNLIHFLFSMMYLSFHAELL